MSDKKTRFKKDKFFEGIIKKEWSDSERNQKREENIHEKSSFVFLTLMIAGSMMTGCSLDRMAKEGSETEKKTVSVTKKTETPAEAPKKTEGEKETSSQEAQPEREDAESSEGTVNNSGQNSEQNVQASQPQDAEEEIPFQGWDSIVLYDIDMNSVQVKQGDDGTGNWYDENGVSYGNLDEVDESQPIENENGEIYYWNGSLAEQAAREANGEEDSGKEGINDPYDLFTWNPMTDTYTPYQQAGSDGSPVGQGTGWYYYNEEAGEYRPW